MDAGVSAVIVGVITAVGGVMVALIQRSRRENRDDHALVMGAMRHMIRVVDRVDTKLDKHIDDHERGKFDGQSG